MKISPRAAAAASLAALILGVTAPAATAAGHASGHGHTQTTHTHGKSGEHPKHTHGTKTHGKTAHGQHAHGHRAHAVDKKVALEKRQVLRVIAHKDARLAQVAKDTRVSTLSQTVKDAVRANVTADRASLAAEAASVQTTDSGAGLKTIRAAVRVERVENYTLAINVLRQATRLQATIDINKSQVSGNADATAANEAAQAALTQAVNQALAVTASSDHAGLHALHQALTEVINALNAVQFLLADPTTTDPGTSTTTPVA